MKRLFAISAIVIFAAVVFAQVPQKMSYQAVIRNSGNDLVTTSPVGMRISILKGSASGPAVYTETQTPTTNANGLVTIEIGGGTPVAGAFAGIDWSSDTYFIKTETDPAGGTTYTIIGTSQLLSVPYALHANTAVSITGGITETDPIFGAWNKSTGISITASQISNFQTSVTNNTAVLANTAKNSYPAADAAKLAGIAAGAEVNVNADWNATSGDAQILNKPVGTNPGDMQYWNGTAWVVVPAGQPGQYLQFTPSNIPAWGGITYPTLITTVVSLITFTSATSGGNISSDGGATVTARGICWNTSTTPTIANNKTNDGTGIGIYASSITGLTLNSTYYLRAYATNNAGTAYGNEIRFTVGIGASYQGGIIAYILQPGDPGYIAGEIHGLIVAPGDQSTGATWGCLGTTISGADGIAIGTGNQNTIDIMNGCATTGIAARLCGDLVLGGYSDWYLPSKDELNKLYLNKLAIGGISGNYYWNSTEYGVNWAWMQGLGGGDQGYGGKDYSEYVRAVRSF